MKPSSGLFACPLCDCLFVGVAGSDGAACPICNEPSWHTGREWMARRAASRAPAAPSASAASAAPAHVAAPAARDPGLAAVRDGVEGRF